MKSIEHIIEPNTLLLTWQGDSRTRYAVASLERLADGNVRLAYIRNRPDYLAAVREGFVGHVAFPTNVAVYERDVLETFMRRLPPRGRSDFAEYLKQFRLRPDVEISDFALLGYTGARLPSDRFAIVPTFENAEPPFEFMTEVAGFRHSSQVAFEDLRVGQKLELVPEPFNPRDARAIRIEADRRLIGYINRCQTSVFHRNLRTADISVTLERLNGTPERRSVYGFVEIRPRDPITVSNPPSAWDDPPAGPPS